MTLTQTEREELDSMHNLITELGLSHFSTPYLERYSELFAKSLEGKGDDNYHFTITTNS